MDRTPIALEAAGIGFCLGYVLGSRKSRWVGLLSGVAGAGVFGVLGGRRAIQTIAVEPHNESTTADTAAVNSG
jgi:hypothetical protein